MIMRAIARASHFIPVDKVLYFCIGEAIGALGYWLWSGMLGVAGCLAFVLLKELGERRQPSFRANGVDTLAVIGGCLFVLLLAGAYR